MKKETQNSLKTWAYLFTTPVLILSCRFGSDAEAILIAKRINLQLFFCNPTSIFSKSPVSAKTTQTEIVGCRLGTAIHYAFFQWIYRCAKVSFFALFQDSSICNANQKKTATCNTSMRKCECFAKTVLLLKLECHVEHSNRRLRGLIPFREWRKREEQARSELPNFVYVKLRRWASIEFGKYLHS